MCVCASAEVGGGMLWRIHSCSTEVFGGPHVEKGFEKGGTIEGEFKDRVTCDCMYVYFKEMLYFINPNLSLASPIFQVV